jgi:hypothetical protein
MLQPHADMAPKQIAFDSRFGRTGPVGRCSLRIVTLSFSTLQRSARTATAELFSPARFARPLGLLLFLLLPLLLGTGCTGSSKYMFEPRLPVPNIAPPNAALVVFLRPSSYASRTVTTILDDQGVFLGDSVAETQFAVAIPPGPHLFLAWGENTAPLIADLLPGRVYYVEVSPGWGFFSPRVQLLAITPKTENWKELGSWLTECSQLVPDIAAGQAYLSARHEAVGKRIVSARERVNQLDDEERGARTLHPEDGVVSLVPGLQAQAQPTTPPPQP